MDFSRLPDNAFLKIIEYLPWEDRIRVGRVDKTFRRIAQVATLRTKSLDLAVDRFRNLSPDQLAVILDLCSSNLKRIKFGGAKENCWIIWNAWNQGERVANSTINIRERQLAITLANYECPQLIDLDLGHTPIGYAVFAQLIQNNPNLESLVWKAEFIGYPPNITNNRLKKLGLYVSNNDAVQSLIGRFPNLKELDLKIGPDILIANYLNQFLASIPQVNHVTVDTCRHSARWEIFGAFDIIFHKIFGSELVNFWNLPLTSLSIRFPTGRSFSGDDILHKLATSFKHLKKLHLDMLAPSNSGIAALATLQDMEILELNITNHGERPFDQGIRQLARCKKLQKLSIKAGINGDTLINLLHCCPQLEYVAIWGISHVANLEEASVILESLAGIAQRHINIELCSYDVAYKCIWKARAVIKMIKNLEENDGLKINFIWVPWIKRIDRTERRWF